MPQVLDPTLVALINARAYGALQTPRRNAGNTSYEWGTAAWLDTTNTFTQPNLSSSYFSGRYFNVNDGVSNRAFLGTAADWGSGGNNAVLAASTSGHGIQLVPNGGTTPAITISSAGNVLVNGFTAGTVGLTVKGATSQSANLAEFQNVSGDTIASVSSSGMGRFFTLKIDSGGVANAFEFGNTGSIGYIQLNTTGSGFNRYDIIVNGGVVTRHAFGSDWNGVSAFVDFNRDNGAGSTPFTFSTTGMTVLQPQTASQVPLTVKGAASQSANLQEWKNSSDVAGARITSAREFSNPSEADRSEKFGAGATVGIDGVAIGNAASAGGLSVSIGSSCILTGGIGIGYSVSSDGVGNILIGKSASCPIANNNIVIGNSASVSGLNNCIVIGNSMTSTAENQLVIGSITNSYIGNGVTASSPSNTTVNATGGSGTDITGATLSLAAGKGTGAGPGGNIKLQTTVAGSSGTTLRTLVDVLTLSPTTQNVLIQTTTAATIGFVVKGAASQSVNIANFTNSSDAVLTCVNKDGHIHQTIGGATLANPGIPVALNTGSPSGTVPWAFRQNAARSASPTLVWMETSDGALGQIAAKSTGMILGAASGLDLMLYANGSFSSPQLNLSSTALTVVDSLNVAVGTTTGTKIATATTQKLGFWNATPVVQPASANQAALSLDVDVTGADTVDKSAVNANFTSIQTLVNQLRADLVTAGLIKGAA